MGNSYFVPRNVKGESRILYIFTVKSFATTAAFALIGFGVYKMIDAAINLSLVNGLIIIGIFGVLGYGLGAFKIPDSPIMGPFRKAGGEELSDIIIRFILFKNKKKMYIYNLKREEMVKESILKKNEEKKEEKKIWMR